MRVLLLLFELPLALLSLALFKVVQFIMRRLSNWHYRRRKAEAFRWNPLSAQTFRNPLALPLLMTSAPRWNPHAIIATLGPLPVQEKLTVDVRMARQSAASWSIVVYTFPGFRTVTSLDSISFRDDEATLVLGPGRYWIGLRYYRWSREIVLPAMHIDGNSAVDALPLSGDVNEFYQELSKRRSWWYVVLHYHAWVALRWKKWLPRRFVERVFLPVGNPGTNFYSGILRKGERLRIEGMEALSGAVDIYLTLYNRGSFPVLWEQLQETCHLTGAMPGPRMYLVRVHPHSEGITVATVAA